jgi:hypothetical protein
MPVDLIGATSGGPDSFGRIDGPTAVMARGSGRSGTRTPDLLHVRQAL